MKINNFSGGLSIRLDPTIIDSSEAIEYVNIDNSKGILASIRNYTNLNTSVEKWFYKFKDVFYSSSVVREYVEYKHILYYTEQSNPLTKVVNGITKSVGIKAPTTALTTVINNTGNLAVTSTTVQYMYTYYDSVDGTESAPSPASAELVVNTSKSVDLSNFVASTNPYVDKIRLYRIGADATDFILIVELPANTTTYNDNIPTLNAIGSILDSYTHQLPPDGVRYIVEAYGILFAALDDNLYYSEVGQPSYWPADNVIKLPRTITGLAIIPLGILIFSATGSHILIGGNPADFRLNPYNSEHGCTNHNSIKEVKNRLLWESADGICSLEGSTISVITKDKLGRVSFNSNNSTVYSEQYMLTLVDGSVLILDFRFERLAIKYLRYPDKEILGIGVFDNVLYGIIENKLTILDSENPIDFYYTSPELTEGDASVIKQYNNIYVRANGTFIIDIFIDNVKVNSYTIVGNKIHDLKVPQLQQRGSSIQFKIQGVGIIKEIEYKVLGRDNGR